MELQNLNREKKMQLLEAIDQGLVPAEYLRPQLLFWFDWFISPLAKEPEVFQLGIYLASKGIAEGSYMGCGGKHFTQEEYKALCEDIQKKYQKRLMLFPEASGDIIIAVHPPKKIDPFPMEEKLREYRANMEAAEKPVETIPDSELEEPAEKALVESIEVPEKEETFLLRRIYPPGL